uniref:Uncharacterized protein n=1 Tax=Pseudomonas fluorescens TaxID=294 RepID=A0A1W6C0M8_PSEFL|nr:hypothetical protein [Pseudomonas fluorescens]
MRVNRKWPLLWLAPVAVMAVATINQYVQHTRQVEARLSAERDTRCSTQLVTPYVPFKDSLDCVGWKRIKSDIPLPAEG